MATVTKEYEAIYKALASPGHSARAVVDQPSFCVQAPPPPCFYDDLGKRFPGRPDPALTALCGLDADAPGAPLDQ